MTTIVKSKKQAYSLDDSCLFLKPNVSIWMVKKRALGWTTIFKG